MRPGLVRKLARTTHGGLSCGTLFGPCPDGLGRRALSCRSYEVEDRSGGSDHRLSRHWRKQPWIDHEHQYRYNDARGGSLASPADCSFDFCGAGGHRRRNLACLALGCKVTDDKDKPNPKGSLVPLPGKAWSVLPTALANFVKGAPAQQDHSAQASTGSIAIGGNNTAPILNVNATNVSIAVERQIARELPSYLSNVVARFSEDLSEYDTGPKRSLPPEVNVKLAYNDFPPSHHIITDYSKYLNVLEATYRGVEQRNDDARRLVRRRAAVAYTQELHEQCATNGIKHANAHDFARSHAVPLVIAVVATLLADFTTGSAPHVMQETAHLAICLIVADAVIECEVLERPVDAIAS